MRVYFSSQFFGKLERNDHIEGLDIYINCNSKVWFEGKSRIELAQNKFHCNVIIIVAMKFCCPVETRISQTCQIFKTDN